MTSRSAIRHCSVIFVLIALLAGASTAHAGRCVGVFFRGFNAPVGTSGMDNLEAHLVTAFGGDPMRPFSTAVFDWTGQQAAFDFIDGFSDIDCVVLAGHSFGANSALEFTTGFLEPAGIPVDLLVQFDSVGANDDVLPASVAQGFNYHQVSTGFFEPQGTSNVQGAVNVYVEQDYAVADSAISHTEIDCPLFERNAADYAALFGTQPDLYERVEGHVAPLFPVAAVPSMTLFGLGGLATGLILLGPALLRGRAGRAGDEDGPAA